MIPSLIVKLGLEARAIRFRQEGLSHRAIAEKLSEQSGESISYKSVERYLAAVGQEAVVVAHRPRYAEAQVESHIDVLELLRGHLVKLAEWRDEADAVVEGEGPDWRARLGVVRESRETAKAYAETLAQAYNADQIARFQATVQRVLGQCSPELERDVRAALARDPELAGANLGAGR